MSAEDDVGSWPVAPPALPPPLSPPSRCASDNRGFEPVFVLGVGLAALSALISSVALLIMKRSADIEAGMPLRRRKRWILGFVMNTASELSLSMIALGMAPLAILSPVFGLAIVFSAVLARLGWVPGVHETLSYAEWLSIAMVVTGIGLCSAYGPSSEDELPFDEIGGYFGRPAFLSYACLALAFVFGWVALLAPRSPLRAWRPDPRSLKLSIGTSAASGIAGAFSTVFGKIVSEAIFTRLLSKGDTSVVSNGVTWAALLGILCAAPVQLWMLNWSLGSGKAAFTVPLYTVMIISNNVCLGGLLLDEFSCLAQSHWQMAIFITALMLVVAGVASLSAQQEGAKLKVGDAAPNGVTTPEASHSVTIFAGVAGAAQHEQATVEMFHGSFLSPRRVPRRTTRLRPASSPSRRDSPQLKAESAFESRARSLQQILSDLQNTPPLADPSPRTPTRPEGQAGEVLGEHEPWPSTSPLAEVREEGIAEGGAGAQAAESAKGCGGDECPQVGAQRRWLHREQEAVGATLPSSPSATTSLSTDAFEASLDVKEDAPEGPGCGIQ
uniref:Uncharacterized protein n=1 Tax=Emiliania huxleyi TaxID=2903 RepID=A0A7S3RZA6_EMIHU|mmetsp:Transcript_32002/g.95302  ORF Transcript_32002/g.95302 Transcript_32002/m.95302 type:complete len:555 (+) Transcript_32002:150-1814(+)